MIQRTAFREPLDTTAEIETPEHVRFRYHIAGPAKRALAYLIDLVVRAASAVVLAAVAHGPGTVMALVSSATAAPCARSLPTMEAPVSMVMAEAARMVPVKAEFVPRVAEVPTAQ